MSQAWSALEPYGDFLTVCGAVVIFLSWVTNSMVQERFKDAADSAGQLRESFLLFETLREVAGSIESLAGIALNVSSDVTGAIEMLSPPSDRADKRAWFEQNRKILQLSASKLNARQIDAGIMFCNLALRGAGEADSAHTRELRSAVGDMEHLRDQKDDIFIEAEASLQAASPADPSLAGLKELLERYSLLIRESVATVNNLISERAAKADRFRSYARWARRATLSLYATGSVMAVVGAALTSL